MTILVNLELVGARAGEPDLCERTLLHRGRSYAALHGADLVDLVETVGDEAALRLARAFLDALARREPWRRAARERVERLVRLLDEYAGSARISGTRRRARAHRALLRRLQGLDGRAREARARAVVALPLENVSGDADAGS